MSPPAPLPPLQERAGDGLSERTALLLACALAAAPHWRAFMGGLSYYFRDFSVAFYPLRLFQARELGQGRLPFWNPYIHQGSFVLPALYPVELLHAVWPGPGAVSWLLTMHVPLAAAMAYALAREMGASRPGAVTGGALYALGGLAASSLNLYIFLQALAWAPAVAAAGCRAARRGGRSVAVLGIVVALAVSTMAVEFVAQAMLLGLALGLAASPSPRALLRMGAGMATGIALAGVPLAVAAGFVGETVRGQGFDPTVGLANEVHPLALLQVLVPDLFGALDAPVELWWGGRFFTKGFPYFLSLHLGGVALALAALGWRRLPPRTRRAAGVLALLALWYSLGTRGGLAPLVQGLPGVSAFRFPSKALLLPYLLFVPAAALGWDRVRAGASWRAVTGCLLAVAAVAALPALLLALFRQPVSAWAGLPEWAVGRVLASSAIAAAVALVGAGVAVLAGRRAMGAPVAAALLAGVALADVARAHAGANPQVSARFYESLPEMAALRLADAGRVFSYGPDESPAFRGLLASRTPGLALWSFFVNRQLLGPYTNILDRVETPDAKDLTSLVPRPVLFAPADYDPGQVAGILPGLRQSGVAHVLSLDPLHHPGLRERAVVDSGAPGLQIHVYALEPTLPRAYVACKVQGAASMDDALARPFAPGFDATRDVALEAAAAPVGCRSGAARRLAPASPDEDAYEVQADGPALLVTRERYARGWTARVDGTAAPVLRANGLHRAVAVPAGTHEVRWQYRPPGLALGLALMAAGAAGLAGVLLWPRWI